MKRMLILLTLLAMAAPSVSSAWSPNFSRMSDDDMRKAICRNAIRLDFEVITSMNGSQSETIVRPAQVDLFPEPAQVRQFRVGVGTELAQMFEVGSTVNYIPYPEYSVEKGGPMVMESAAGTSNFGGSTLIRRGGGMYQQVR